jgi:hypothetical protein
VARKKLPKPAVLARRALVAVAGSLLMGILAVLLEVALREFLPRHASVSLAVGVAVAITFWLLRFLKHPPMFLKNVHPLAAGLCAGLGVQVARLWLR